MVLPWQFVASAGIAWFCLAICCLLVTHGREPPSVHAAWVGINNEIPAWCSFDMDDHGLVQTALLQALRPQHEASGAGGADITDKAFVTGFSAAADGVRAHRVSRSPTSSQIVSKTLNGFARLCTAGLPAVLASDVLTVIILTASLILICGVAFGFAFWMRRSAIDALGSLTTTGTEENESDQGSPSTDPGRGRPWGAAARHDLARRRLKGLQTAPPSRLPAWRRNASRPSRRGGTAAGHRHHDGAGARGEGGRGDAAANLEELWPPFWFTQQSSSSISGRGSEEEERGGRPSAHSVPAPARTTLWGSDPRRDFWEPPQQRALLPPPRGPPSPSRGGRAASAAPRARRQRGWTSRAPSPLLAKGCRVRGLSDTCTEKGRNTKASDGEERGPATGETVASGAGP